MEALIQSPLEIIETVEQIVVFASALIGFITGWFGKKKQQNGTIQKLTDEHQRQLRLTMLDNLIQNHEQKLKEVETNGLSKIK